MYLDGSWSTVQGPNESYARELQELFTIGQKVSVLGKHVYRSDGVIGGVCDLNATGRFIAYRSRARCAR